MIFRHEIGIFLQRACELDRETLEAYNHDAVAFANEWEAQPPPADMYSLVRQYFEPGLTADIGCGSGRDTDWLTKNGYTGIGFDASEGLLAEARRLHPDIEFRYGALPELRGVARGAFSNVLCETVIMHLSPDAIELSVRSLLEILRPGGTLYLSWRATEKDNKRDERGRLYSAFEPTVVLRGLASEKILFSDRHVSGSSRKAIQRVIVRKISPPDGHVA
jgi:SAM-dependent methyltransferase